MLYLCPLVGKSLFALEEPLCPPELAKVGALLTHHISPLDRTAKTETKANENLTRLIMLEVDIYTRTPKHRLYRTPYLGFYLDELSPALSLKPGKKMKIETRLESHEGQVQEISVLLKDEDGDEFGSLRFLVRSQR